MLVLLKVAVETLGVARTFYDEGRPDLIQCQQRPVHRIQRYVWVDLPDLCVQHLGRRMRIRLDKLAVYRHPLRRYFQALLPAQTCKPGDPAVYFFRTDECLLRVHRHYYVGLTPISQIFFLFFGLGSKTLHFG